MKATELMIGDWVGRVFDDKHIDYRQVDWIRTGEIGMCYQKVWAIGCILSYQNYEMSRTSIWGLVL